MYLDPPLENSGMVGAFIMLVYASVLMGAFLITWGIVKLGMWILGFREERSLGNE
jgi:hypothetical protein